VSCRREAELSTTISFPPENKNENYILGETKSPEEKKS